MAGGIHQIQEVPHDVIPYTADPGCAPLKFRMMSMNHDRNPRSLEWERRLTSMILDANISRKHHELIALSIRRAIGAKTPHS